MEPIVPAIVFIDPKTNTPRNESGRICFTDTFAPHGYCAKTYCST